MRPVLVYFLLLAVLASSLSTITAQLPYLTQGAHERNVDSLVSIIKQAKEDTNLVNTLNAISREHFEWSAEEVPKGHEYAVKALKLAEKLRYRKGEAEAALWIGYYHAFIKNDSDEGLRLYKKVLQIWSELNDRTQIINTLISTAWLYDAKKDSIEALSYFTKAIDLGVRHGDNENLVNCYAKLGMFFHNRMDHQNAIKNYLVGLKIGNEVYNRLVLAEISNNIALVYWSAFENYPEALKHLLNRKKFGGSNNGNISSLYTQMGYYEEALDVWKEFLEAGIKENDKQTMLNCYDQMARICVKMAASRMEKKNSVDSVRWILDRAQNNFSIAEQLKIELNTKFQPMSKREVGDLYLLQAKESGLRGNDLSLTERKLDSALLTFFYILNNVKQRYPALLIRIAKVYYEKGELLKENSAATHFRKAILYADSSLQKNENKEIMRDAYELLSKAYAKIGELERALEYRNRYSEIKEELSSTETSRKFEQVKTLHEAELAAAETKGRYERLMEDVSLRFTKREDSIRYEQNLIALQLNRKNLLSKQQEQDLLLKQQALNLLSKENEINRLNYIKSRLELTGEQTKREEKEKALTIANQEKSLQSAQLALKENQIEAQNKQRVFLISGIALLSIFLVFIYRNSKSRQRTERMIATERLKTEKANAAHTMAELELQSLRAQLNPHFMFNSLNAIQELILKEDNDNSHLYLSRFSELLRMLLDNANQPFVPLRKELNLLELYLSLEKLRIPDLKYSIEIDNDVDLNKMTIPNMMLQPYIENAIWHGLSHKKGEKNLFITINKKSDSVVCKVEDNGVGRKMSSELKSLYRKEHRSRGMELLSKRFNLLSKEYGSAIQTDIEDLHDNGTATGTKVSIILPHSFTEQTQPVYS